MNLSRRQGEAFGHKIKGRIKPQRAQRTLRKRRER